MQTSPRPRTADKTRDPLDVLNIQRTCVHDGPGIRTVVFFRGCNLRCRWCHNPEAQSRRAVTGPHAGSSTADLLEVIRRDRAYFSRSHGGVTLSGGEPLLQPTASLVELLATLKEEGLHVAVETAGHVSWSAFAAVLPYVDLFLFDLKAVATDALHVELTGAHRKRIAQNAKRLVTAGAQVQFRMCVVPGLNDHPRNLEATASFLHSLRRPALTLLRYYDVHETKARRLGLAQEPLGISPQRSVEALEHVARALRALNIEVECTQAPAARQPLQISPRVQRIRQDIRDAGYHVCLETAALKTRFYRERGFADPALIQRAELLRYLLNRKQVIIHPHELLVGNYTAKRVGGHMWVEYFGVFGALNVWNADRQKPVSFQCSLQDKLLFYLRLLPFWLKHGLMARIFPSARELALFSARMAEKRVAFQNNLAALAHYIVNTKRILDLGTTGLRAEVAAARRAPGSRGRAAFYESVNTALLGLEEFADRYAARLRDLSAAETDPARREELAKMAAVCSHVPRYPARTFHEALQSILFFHIALCTESFENAISFGRLDQVLEPYYRRDVEAGSLTSDQARELLACFILKVDEIIFVNDGDVGFQFGKLFESLSPVETVTIGGVDENGQDCTNDLTYMILDVCELHPIGVNMAARVHPRSPDRYLERIAEVYLSGSPMPALFNDDPYIQTLRRHYPSSLEEARNYAIVGCVEPAASDDHFGNTDCANVNVTMPFLQALRGDERPLWKYGVLDRPEEKLRRFVTSKLGRDGDRGRWAKGPAVPVRPPASMDELMTRFQARMNELLSSVLADHAAIEAALSRGFTTPLASALFPGCLASGKDVYEGGASINSSGIQAAGITDVADSLVALEEVVFRQRRYSFDEVIHALDANFEGEDQEGIREALLAAPKFGDDSAPQTTEWMHRVLQVYVNALAQVRPVPRGGKYVAGYYGLNVNLVYGKRTPALPSGRLAGVPLANSLCPHYGMQMADLVSSLNSVASLDFAGLAPNGTTLTSTIDAGLFPGEVGVRNLAALIRGYFDQGGMQLQPNILSREILLDAYRNPGKHKDLVVRIAGYCAYFDDLSDDLKREIINRTYYSDPQRT